MRRPFLVLTIAVVLLARAPVRADDLVLRLFGDYLDALRIQAGIPGLSAALVGDNDIIWERAFGQQDVARSITTKSDTPFQFDGLTQVFTAAMVLRCVEEGRLSLDERIALFKLAWDVTGETFAQRMQQYVRFYSGDPIRLTAGFYAQYDKVPLFEIVERALGRRDGEPIPISADDASAPVPYQPDTRGMAGTYAATSLPAQSNERR